ncbi:MAG: hypothetical protein WBC44_19890, partial [Planctomycetaceae bacterium]
MIAPLKHAPSQDGLWSHYVTIYLARLKLQSPRHYITGKHVLDRFTRAVGLLWVEEGHELGQARDVDQMRVVDVSFRLYQQYVACRCA